MRKLADVENYLKDLIQIAKKRKEELAKIPKTALENQLVGYSYALNTLVSDLAKILDMEDELDEKV